jgi:hypothetical protein
MAEGEITFRFKDVTWWAGAYHVYVGDERYGVVKRHDMVRNGKPTAMWECHNANMLPVEGVFWTRGDAAKAIPKPHSPAKSKNITRGMA